MERLYLRVGVQSAAELRRLEVARVVRLLRRVSAPASDSGCGAYGRVRLRAEGLLFAVLLVLLVRAGLQLVEERRHGCVDGWLDEVGEDGCGWAVLCGV